MSNYGDCYVECCYNEKCSKIKKIKEKYKTRAKQTRTSTQLDRSHPLLFVITSKTEQFVDKVWPNKKYENRQQAFDLAKDFIYDKVVESKVELTK